jgi:anaerobic selenocysteine-containing dehydrogenase
MRERLWRTGPGVVVRFLISAHAALEEMFLVRALARRLHGAAADGAVAVSWSAVRKDQPAGAKFRVPDVDAPNLRGAADLGLGVPADRDGQADTTALRTAVEGGQVSALYVLDSGPAGSIGDVGWIIEARQRGTLPLLIVHGVLMSDLAREADFVLPGAASFEKEACYANESGIVQPAARVLAPGDAMEDWRTLVNVAVSVGMPLPYSSAAQVRADIAADMSRNPAYARIATPAFAEPVVVRHWLQASNPSEREKWDALFKDLPPVKFEESPGGKTS